MTEQFLHGADVVAVFEQMRCEGMAPRKSYAYAVDLAGFFFR